MMWLRLLVLFWLPMCLGACAELPPFKDMGF